MNIKKIRTSSGDLQIDYSSLDNKPRIGGVELLGDKTVEDLGMQPKGDYVTSDNIPDSLPNPYALHITGAVNAVYDGSSDVTVEIPSGGGGEPGGLIIDDTQASKDNPWSGKKTNDEIQEVSLKINEIASVGKNLFDLRKVIRDGDGAIDSMTGEIKDGSTWVYGFIDLSVGETYTLSNISGTTQLFFYNSDETYTDYSTIISSNVQSGQKKTFTANYPLARLVSYKEASIVQVQLEKGEEKTDYEPFCFYLGGNVNVTAPGVMDNLLEKDKIDDFYIKDSGIQIQKMKFSSGTYNILNPGMCESGYFSNNGDIQQSDSFFVTDFLPIGEEKTLSFNENAYSIAVFDSDRVFLEKTQGVYNNKVYEISNESAKFVRVCFNALLSNAYRFMVYFGDVGRPFIPYRVIPIEYIEDTDTFPSDVSIVLPSQIAVCEGKTVYINHQSVVRNFDIKKAIRSGYTALSKCRTFDYKTELVGGSSGKIDFVSEIYYDNLVVKSFELISVPKNSGSGETKTILFIGDSKTDANVYTQNLLDMFSEDDMNIKLIGTRGNTEDNKHEGRSGWSAENYVENNANRGVIEESPFWNPDTEKFDFSYYMSKNGYDSVDYVFINLGTNDSYSNFIEYYHKMIDGIKSYNNDIIIGLWVPAPFATFGGYSHIDNDNQTFQMMQAIIDEFDNEESRLKNIFVIPTHMNIDTYYDFPWDDISINKLTDATFRVCKDQIHESNGYEHVSDVIFGYIKYFATLNNH